MRKEAWDQWSTETPGFKEFRSFLNGLAESESRCSCHSGACGPPFCSIRKCTPEKGVNVRPFCDKYPCYRILGIAKGYVSILTDAERMKTIKIDSWIAEQEGRRKTGFAYVDIRCYPYEVPQK